MTTICTVCGDTDAEYCTDCVRIEPEEVARIIGECLDGDTGDYLWIGETVAEWWNP